MSTSVMSGLFGRSIRYTRLNGSSVARSPRTRHKSDDDGDDAGEDVSRNSHKGAQVQNVKSSTIYVFGDADIGVIAEEEVNTDNAIEMRELRMRGPMRFTHEERRDTSVPEEGEEFMECKIGEEDTLQNIALKYGCKVAELMRLNKLIREQDFFALQRIRVPVKPHGLLTELLHEAKDEVNKGDIEKDRPTVTPISIRNSLSGDEGASGEFLRRMDADLQRIVTSTRSRKDSLPAVAAALTEPRIRPLQKINLDVHWSSMVIIMIVVTILAPAAYFAYYEFGHTT